MEATLTRGFSRRIDAAASEWLRATRRLADAVGRRTWEALVSTSRAGLLVASGSRPQRRL